MVDWANLQRKDHIITVEDPIEFVHRSQQSLVNHREVGVHTKSFASALRGALREDPDIILVGEMRDLETIELALTAAATGHLVFGTLHTPSAPKTIDRIIDVFPAGQQNQIRAGRSRNRSRAWSRKTFSGGSTSRAAWPRSKCSWSIRPSPTSSAKAKTHQIPGMMQVGKKKGNQPLDDAIMEHLRAARISPEEA